MNIRRLAGLIGVYFAVLVFFNVLEYLGFFQTGFKRTIAEAVQKKRGNPNKVIIDINSLSRFQWDKLHIFTPYMSYEDIKAELGFDWPYAKMTGIEWDDGICLLVFVKDTKVVKYLVYPRHVGDFLTIGKKGGYSPEEAVFEVKEEDWGEPWLVIREIDSTKAADTSNK